ncbi:Panacea domain-containing protein [Candidatus Hepatoplasma crinochetorum]|uniref:Antitoxin SocA-like Panacea domain-containing protein n=1 Tax=Candidatus Hepatoplasma crinochetorum Av TaxID=1427984 RepID=W8GN50_9MOLU|nr:type II toxin-antitoxin system antitoxin SocA domain-containing protein [Candidatus Hepatoplasma crinochetorum]AHK22426.1 hypothetical protein X271_00320 [Candidatus Hepatoplasma crinochetorum Av]BDV03015.1 MAG: hypothetical protein HCTKY_3090 [Candidatus Hepatoplasma crinochetorum]
MDLVNEIKKIHLKLNKNIREFNKSEKNKEEIKVSELQIHKILYFVYGYFWKKYQEELFAADFEAWKYGPIEINYRINKKIIESKIIFNEEKKEFIKDKINKLLVYEIWFLIEQSHLTTPWIKNFNSDKDPKKIDNNEIKDFFEKLY